MSVTLLPSHSPHRRRRNAPLTEVERGRAMDRLSLLRKLSFGSQVAEEEIQDLGKYFVQTDQWEKIIGGHIDIIRGEKGAGKSAIYLLLNQNEALLERRMVFICNAENPKGSTVFKDLVSDPPASEAEFILLWKIYILSLVADQISSRNLKSRHFKPVFTALQEAGLLEAKLNLSGLLRSAQILARRLLTQTRVEAGMEINEVTGSPSGYIGRLSLKEPTGELRSKGINSLDGYLAEINEGLKEAGWSAWILLDRLDVAFAESHQLEANAIRALLRTYRDISALDNLCPKIFLREDIWRRVTEDMREASHPH